MKVQGYKSFPTLSDHLVAKLKNYSVYDDCVAMIALYDTVYYKVKDDPSVDDNTEYYVVSYKKLHKDQLVKTQSYLMVMIPNDIDLID